MPTPITPGSLQRADTGTPGRTSTHRGSRHDDLLAEAQRLTGMKEKTLLVREGLTALIERESARRLARLGGTEPARRAARPAGQLDAD